MKARVLTALCGTLALAFLVAGCGGGGEGPTKAAFIKEADAICAKGGEEIQGNLEGYAERHRISLARQPSSEQVRELSEEVVIPGIDDQLEQLRELDLPSQGADEVEAIFDALEKGIAAGEEDPIAFIRNRAALAKAELLAREFGFKSCGSG